MMKLDVPDEEYEILYPADAPDDIPRREISIIRTKDQTLWASYAMTPLTEVGALFVASYSGAMIFTDDDGHQYYPLAWVEETFPDCVELARKVRERAAQVP